MKCNEFLHFIQGLSAHFEHEFPNLHSKSQGLEFRVGHYHLEHFGSDLAGSLAISIPLNGDQFQFWGLRLERWSQLGDYLQALLVHHTPVVSLFIEQDLPALTQAVAAVGALSRHWDIQLPTKALAWLQWQLLRYLLLPLSPTA